MDFFWLLWIFFIISSLQPVIRQKMLQMARLRMLQRLERQRKSRVILLIHRQETMSLLGFPILRYIDIEDSEAVLRAIKLTDDNLPIDLVLHTPGGLVLAAEQIAQALCNHPAKVTVHVPHYAMSGGTLIALAADEIVMDDNAVLGPVDPQLGQQPAASILKVLERKDINQVDDSSIILADLAEKAIRQVNEARDLRLPVSTDMPKEVYELMNLYPQARQRRPSVEYIPMPYGPPKERHERQPAHAEQR